MFHYTNSIQNKQGDVLPGYFVQAIDPATGLVVAIYSDKNVTPIISVSGIANTAKVDANGLASFYIADGNYNVNIYAQDATTLKGSYLDVPMVGSVSLTIGTVSTLAAGAPATASIDASSSPAKLNLGLPITTGAAGAAGANGATGSSTGLTLLLTGMAGATVAAPVTTVQTAGYSVASIGGANYIYDAAVNAAYVTANPRTSFQAADSRGFRLDPKQRLTVEMFGAVADYVSKASRGTDNYAALLAAATFLPTANRFAPEVNLGIGIYYCSATLEPHNVFALAGVPHAMASDPTAGFAASSIIWPINTRCIEIVTNNTTGDITSAGVNSASMSKIRYILVQQETDISSNVGTNLNAHGIHCRAAAWIEGCTYDNIAGDGERFAATSGGGGAIEGEASNWVSINNYVHLCGGNGHNAFGQDANIGYCQGFRTKSCGLAGIRDNSAYVNVYVQSHLAGYGTGGVQYGGRAWQPIQDSTNQTPANNGLYWYDRGVLAAPSVAFPAWSGATAYLAKGPAISLQNATFLGTYIEGGYGYAHAPNGSVYGPDMGWTFHSNTLASLYGGITSKQQVGYYRSVAGDTTHPAFAQIGQQEYTVLGGINPNEAANDMTKKRALRLHYSNGNTLSEYYVGNDIFTVAASRSAMSITGTGTARTFGRSAGLPGVVTLHDFALINPQDSTNPRIYGVRDSVPTTLGDATTYHAVGEFYFSTVAGIFGYRCEVAGTPGTFTTIPTVGPKQTGWTPSTGTPSRGAFAAAAATAPSAAYVQAEATASATRIAALEARLIALEADARTFGIIN